MTKGEAGEPHGEETAPEGWRRRRSTVLAVGILLFSIEFVGTAILAAIAAIVWLATR